MTETRVICDTANKYAKDGAYYLHFSFHNRTSNHFPKKSVRQLSLMSVAHRVSSHFFFRFVIAVILNWRITIRRIFRCRVTVTCRLWEKERCLEADFENLSWICAIVEELKIATSDHDKRLFVSFEHSQT